MCRKQKLTERAKNALIEGYNIVDVWDLIEQGADPNIVLEGGGDITTPLIEAVYLNNANRIRQLLEAGADPNLSVGNEYYMNSPFISAMDHLDRRYIVDMFREYGYEPEDVDYY